MWGHMLTGRVATRYGTGVKSSWGMGRGRGDIVKCQSAGVVEQLGDVNAELLKTGACKNLEIKQLFHVIRIYIK